MSMATGERKKSEVLREAMALIAEPGRWCQGMDAATVAGKPVFASDNDAARWCAVAAVVRVVGGGPGKARPVTEVLREAAGQLGHRSAESLNDHGTHADVLAMFTRAIALAEQ